MTAYELMETNQNEAFNENKSLKLSKFLNSTPALNTPPPESIDFYQEISLSDISLNRLEHIVEDTALTPLIHTPPQSATFSLERKSFHKLSSEFGSRHSAFKLNLQRSLERLNRLRHSYLRQTSSRSNELTYELEKTRLESDNELTDEEVEADDSSFWSSTRLRLGSEWTRCRQKISLIESRKNSLRPKAQSAQLINIKNQLKLLSNKNHKSIDYFRTSVIKSNCACDSIANKQEMCIFCSLERLSKPKSNSSKRPIDHIYFDHSYTKLPKLVSSSKQNDMDFLDCVDDQALDKMVNERLDQLFNPVDHLSKQNSSLPILTTEELMECFEEKFEPNFLDIENLSPRRPSKKSKTYDQTKLKEFRFGATKKTLTQKPLSNLKDSGQKKKAVRSRSSSASVITDDSHYLSSNTDKFNINNILIPNELIGNQKISFMPDHKINTPGWRIVDIEPLGDGLKPDEELDDVSILDRHLIIEMKEKINFSNLKNSLNNTLRDSETILSTQESINLGWPARKFPLSDQDYKLMVDES